jgi:hypothetical protein
MLSVAGLVNSFRESLEIRFVKAKVIDLRFKFHCLVSLCYLQYFGSSTPL